MSRDAVGSGGEKGGVMVPEKVVRHLEKSNVPVVARSHEREVTAQRLAAAVHVTGYRVAKSVLVEADGQRWMAVLPAADIVDVSRLAASLGASSVRVMREAELFDLFPDCELGAEPPFGSLFGFPVVMDRILARATRPLVVRAGSHEEILEISAADFMRLERPRIADFAVIAPTLPRADDAGAYW